MKISSKVDDAPLVGKFLEEYVIKHLNSIY